VVYSTLRFSSSKGFFGFCDGFVTRKGGVKNVILGVTSHMNECIVCALRKCGKKKCACKLQGSSVRRIYCDDDDGLHEHAPFLR
jgi:hypothetical protein